MVGTSSGPYYTNRYTNAATTLLPNVLGLLALLLPGRLVVFADTLDRAQGTPQRETVRLLGPFTKG